MFHLFPRHNGALNANPPAGDRHLTTHGSDFAWMVFSVMLLSFLITLGWMLSNRRFIRIQHFIPTIVLLVSFVTYFLLASDLGWALVRAEFESHPTRQIFYVRYIQWFINAPLILLSLLSFTRMSTPQILFVLFLSWALVVCGLGGAFIASSYKWGLYAFAVFFLILIWYFLLGHVVISGFSNDAYRTRYYIFAAWISFIWLFYPICWGLSEGGNAISSTGEMVFYGVLDLCSGPVFLLSYIIAYLGRFDTQELAPTAFGNAERGVYDQLPQQPQPQQQQQAVPQKGPQPDNAHPAV